MLFIIKTNSWTKVLLKLSELSYWCITVVESYVIIFFPLSNWKTSALGPNITHLQGTKHLIQKSDICVSLLVYSFFNN